MLHRPRLQVGGLTLTQDQSLSRRGERRRVAGMKQVLLICAVVALVGGCAAPSMQIVPSPPGEISAPNNGMSRIIVYRLPRFTGGAVGIQVFLNGYWMGYVGPKEFLYWETEPGSKTLEMRLHSLGQSSSSGPKQFHSKSNGLTVLETSLVNRDLFDLVAPKIRILSGAEKEKLLSELKSRAK